MQYVGWCVTLHERCGLCVENISICASNMFVEQSEDILLLVSSGCSTSMRLSDEIRSRACLSPPPPSIFLSIFPSPSVCLPPRSLPLCFSPHPYPSSCDRFFFIFPSSVFMQLSAEPKNLPALLSSMIAFHPSSSFSHYLSLPSVSLSVLISVIRLRGISWD